jgi:hypothetical protein
MQSPSILWFNLGNMAVSGLWQLKQRREKVAKSCWLV